MTLHKDNTRWLFLCAVYHEKKDKERHLYDLSFAVFSLLSKKIPLEKIDIIIDSDINSIKNKFISSILSRFIIYKENKLNDLILSSKESNLILIVLGHGNEDGIGTKNPVKPFSLINQINCNKTILTASVILGQCFAGVFNYLDTYKHNNAEQGKEKSSICFIGASHLNQSLSGKIDVVIDSIPYTWVANIYLFNFFLWILFPNDIDGDSKCTLMDAFKYSGAKTSQKLIQIKKEMFQITSRLNIDLYNLSNDIENLKKQINDIEIHDKSKRIEKSLLLIPINRELEKKELEHSSILEISENVIELSYTNQDPWILNAHAARNLEFYLGE